MAKALRPIFVYFRMKWTMRIARETDDEHERDDIEEPLRPEELEVSVDQLQDALGEGEGDAAEDPDAGKGDDKRRRLEQDRARPDEEGVECSHGDACGNGGHIPVAGLDHDRHHAGGHSDIRAHRDVKVPRDHKERCAGSHEAEHRHLLQDVLDVVQPEEPRIDETRHDCQGDFDDEKEKPLFTEDRDGSPHVRVR